MSATMQELRDKIAKARHIAEGVSGIRIHVRVCKFFASTFNDR